MLAVSYEVPLTIVAGDSLEFRQYNGDFLPSDGWSMLFSLRGGGSEIDLESTSDGEDHVFEINPNTTETWAPGRYTSQGYAVHTGLSKRILVYRGLHTIEPNLFEAGATFDSRSHARRTLDLIEATIEGRATDDILDTAIQGTSFRRLTPYQLLVLKDEYAALVRSEEARARVQNGRATGRRILTRFTRA
jgi:hypothetical protein